MTSGEVDLILAMTLNQLTKQAGPGGGPLAWLERNFVPKTTLSGAKPAKPFTPAEAVHRNTENITRAARGLPPAPLSGEHLATPGTPHYRVPLGAKLVPPAAVGGAVAMTGNYGKQPKFTQHNEPPTPAAAGEAKGPGSFAGRSSVRDIQHTLEGLAGDGKGGGSLPPSSMQDLHGITAAKGLADASAASELRSAPSEPEHPLAASLSAVAPDVPRPDSQPQGRGVGGWLSDNALPVAGGALGIGALAAYLQQRRSKKKKDEGGEEEKQAAVKRAGPAEWVDEHLSQPVSNKFDQLTTRAGTNAMSGAMGGGEGGIGGLLGNSKALNYAMYGAPIGAGLGALGSLLGGKKKRRNLLGDALTGGLLGAAGGGLAGGAMDLMGGDGAKKPPAQQPGVPTQATNPGLDKLRGRGIVPTGAPTRWAQALGLDAAAAGKAVDTIDPRNSPTAGQLAVDNLIGKHYGGMNQLFNDANEFGMPEAVKPLQQASDRLNSSYEAYDDAIKNRLPGDQVSTIAKHIGRGKHDLLMAYHDVANNPNRFGNPNEPGVYNWFTRGSRALMEGQRISPAPDATYAGARLHTPRNIIPDLADVIHEHAISAGDDTDRLFYPPGRGVGGEATSRLGVGPREQAENVLALRGGKSLTQYGRRLLGQGSADTREAARYADALERGSKMWGSIKADKDVGVTSDSLAALRKMPENAGAVLPSVAATDSAMVDRLRMLHNAQNPKALMTNADIVGALKSNDLVSSGLANTVRSMASNHDLRDGSITRYLPGYGSGGMPAVKMPAAPAPSSLLGRAYHAVDYIPSKLTGVKHLGTTALTGSLANRNIFQPPERTFAEYAAAQPAGTFDVPARLMASSSDDAAKQLMASTVIDPRVAAAALKRHGVPDAQIQEYLKRRAEGQAK